MAKQAKKQEIVKGWREVRAVLATQGSAQLLEVARDLYHLSQENRDFLNARCLATENRLEPYKEAIDEAIYPDIYSNKPIRISAAKKAISQYMKGTSDEAGTIELMVYFVERGTQCTVDFGDIDEGFYSSLESMFGRVLEALPRAEPEVVERVLPRLVAIRDAAAGVGWGYHDFLRDALATAFPDMAGDRAHGDEAMISPRRSSAGHLRPVSSSDGPTTAGTRNTSAPRHTNRHGVTFYLHQGTTKTGKPKYYVAKTVGTGALGRMPAGFEFAESINGVVSVRRVDDSPRLIPDEDVELVRNELARHRHLRHHRVEVTKADIVIYEPAGAPPDSELEEMARGLGCPADAFEERMAGFWARRKHQPVMRFLASSDRGGNYAVHRMTYRGEGGWSYPLAHGPLAKLVKDFVPSLGTERFFELF